jgi:predicted HTH transcriptional regulator
MSDAVTEMVEKFVADLRKVIRAELVQSLLAGESLTAAQPGKSATPKIVRAPGKRTAEMIAEQAKQVLVFLKKNPQSSAQQIAEGTGMELKELALPMETLKADKSVKTVGQRRGTKYSAK